MDENKSIDQIEDVTELEKIPEKKTEEKPVEEIQEEKPVEEIPLIKSGDGDSDELQEESTGTYAIVNRHVYDITNGANVDICDIIADSKTDLPTDTDLIINRIGFGSFGYCITEREFYCLSSGGEWL